jgi:hypothetical protein
MHQEHHAGPDPGVHVGTPSALGWRPVIFDLRRNADAARFGLEPGERDYLLGRCYPNRQGRRPELICFHIQEGHTAGSLDHWVNGRDWQGNPIAASATVLITKGGEIVRCIDEGDGPWTNGDLQSPTARGVELTNRWGTDLNPVSLTIEAEGMPQDVMPEPQLRAVVWQANEWMRRFPWIGADRCFRHADINQVDRPHCPGPYFERVMARLADGDGQTNGNGAAHPTDLSDERLAALFGDQYDPTGPVTILWTQEGRRTGRFPRLERFDPPGPVRFFVFADGFTIRADEQGVRIMR